jgi:hypothetical protein
VIDAFIAFEDAPRWVAWRVEDRGGKPNKIPYDPNNVGSRASTTRPQTWGTSRNAEGCAKELRDEGAMTGIGIVLGDLGDDFYLCGADLDSSLDENRLLAAWAAKVITVLQTYSEVSPSERGLKVFFYVRREHVRPFLELIGVDKDKWGCKRGIPGLSGADHGPAVEIYCSARYFTVTGRLWSIDHQRIALVGWNELTALAALIPPPLHAGGERGAGGNSGELDNSRSGKAWRAAFELHAGTFEEMCAGLRSHHEPHIREWANEVDDRQLQRLWDRGAGKIAAREEALAESLADLDARLPSAAADDAGLDPSATPARPIVQVPAGRLPTIVDAAEAILIEADTNLYEFGDQVVRPARAPIKSADNETTIGLRLVPVRLHHMIERFTRCIEFRKFNKKERQWVPVDCPEAVAKTYLERVGLWRLPKLTALTSCPLLLRDGRIVERPGFDAQSGILFDPQGMPFSPVPSRPGRDDALLALEDIKALFREFPFVDGRARSVLLSALLTSVSRLAYDFAPLHGFDAPVAGSGKSKLVNCCSILINGHECPVISQGDDETEFEKRLGAELLEGSRMISIDNCELPLGGPLLCQAATQPFVKVRVLGFSKSVLIVNSAMLFATGNNLKLYGDALRRGLIGRLDAGEERPELRIFEQEDPERVLKRERGRYAVNLLTMLRAYIIAGRPIRQQPLGGFEGWSNLVRNSLLWLGEEDPVETIESARTEDPQRQQLEAVVTQWCAVLGDRSVTTRTVIEEACGFRLDPTPSNPNHINYFHQEFRNALLDVAGDRGRVSSERLGKWIGANKHKVVDKHRLAPDTPSRGNARWKLELRQTDGRWQ